MAAFWDIFTKKPSRQFFIIFDVGTYSIRSLLVEKNPNGLNELKKQVHILSPKLDEERLARTIGQHLREITFRMVRGLQRIPEEVVIGMGAANIRFVTAEIRKNRADKKKILTPAELADIINEYILNRKETIIDEEKFILEDVRPLQLLVDGYAIESGSAQSISGETIELRLLLTYVVEVLSKELHSLRQILGGLTITLHPTRLLVAHALAEISPSADFVLIKIGGKVTEISLIKQGVLEWTETLPFGGQDLTENLARDLGVSPAHAEEIKRQYGKLLLSPAIEEKTRKTLHAGIQALREKIGEIFTQKQSLLPPAIYLYGGGSRLEIVPRVLREGGWFQNLTFAETLTVELLDAQKLTDNIRGNHILRGPEDVDLAALLKGLAFDLER